MAPLETVLAARRQDHAGRNLEIARQPLVEPLQVELDDVARVQIDPQELQIHPPRLELPVKVEEMREVALERESPDVSSVAAALGVNGVANAWFDCPIGT